MPIAKPVWENKWGPNTVISVLGFTIMLIGGLVAWGYIVAEFRGALATHTVEIEKLDRRLTAVESEVRSFGSLGIRLSNVEKQALDFATAMKAVEATLNALTTEVRVSREILQRLEATSNRNGNHLP
jgi:predicted amino acid-binding ACT domain protein